MAAVPTHAIHTLTPPTTCCTQAFFDCNKNCNSPYAVWYKGMKVKLNRKIFQTKLAEGDKVDNAALSLYLTHVKELCAAFARLNSKEAAKFKLGFKTVWRICGRASEAGFLSLDSMNWDEFFGCPFTEVPQSKSSKLKYALFIAGNDRHSDWFIDYGDYLILDRGRTVYSNDEPNFLIPELAGKDSGTKITQALKGIQPPGFKGHVAKWAEHSISSLPNAPSAGGFGHGACDMIAVAMPAEIGACYPLSNTNSLPSHPPTLPPHPSLHYR